MAIMKIRGGDLDLVDAVRHSAGKNLKTTGAEEEVHALRPVKEKVHVGARWIT